MGLNLIAASIVGGFFAVINYRIKILALQKAAPAAAASAAEFDDDEEEILIMAKKLSRKALNKSFRNWFYSPSDLLFAGA